MICKWCGSPQESGDRVCARCGREIPPISDCGGFYDLVPGACAAAGVGRPAEPAPVPERPVQPRPVPVDQSKLKKRKRRGYERLALLAALVLLVALFLHNCGLSSDLKRTEEELRQVTEELGELKKAQSKDSEDSQDSKETGGSDVPEETGESQTDETAGSEQESTAEWEPESQPEEPAIRIVILANGQADVNTAEYEGWSRNSAEREEDSLRVPLVTPGGVSVELFLKWNEEMEAELTVLEDGRAPEARYAFCWQHRQNGSDDWQDVQREDSGSRQDQPLMNPLDICGTSQKLPQEGGELRCIITRTDNTGETVTIVISGIMFE